MRVAKSAATSSLVSGTRLLHAGRTLYFRQECVEPECRAPITAGNRQPAAQAIRMICSDARSASVIGFDNLYGKMSGNERQQKRAFERIGLGGGDGYRSVAAGIGA
ncbi:hypothetical protein [Paraburkholderia fungorum]|uniref:hypothetical protein n=1 Tax=Paraburkholderia fungorum TaxID=134537 RepID=UPI0038B7EFF8